MIKYQSLEKEPKDHQMNENSRLSSDYKYIPLNKAISDQFKSDEGSKYSIIKGPKSITKSKTDTS